jgi:hypothetical protein
MRMSLLTRAVAATAIASTAMLAVASTAEAAPAPVRTHKSATALSIRGSMGLIKPTRTVDINGVLMTGHMDLGHNVVYLDAAAAAAGGRFTRVGMSKTNAMGWIGFTVKPSRTTRYKLVFPGTSRFAATQSAVVIIRVL